MTSTSTSPTTSRWFRFREWYKRRILFPLLIGLERLIGRLSLVGNPAVFPAGAFPWTRRLEDNWELIRTELDAILAHEAALPALQDIQQEQQYITRDQKWKTFFLIGYGRWAELNCAKCPQTAALLRQIPGLLTAFFSILGPRKHIPRHRGVYKGMIRSHLGLIVPGERCACRMQVGPELVCWEPGKMVVFDNTYEHEVWNDTDERRVVLLIDIVRPFPRSVQWLNRTLIRLIGWSSYVREAAAKHASWEKEFDRSYSRKTD